MTLSTAAVGGFSLSGAASFIIVSRTGGSGTFAGLLEGASIPNFLGSGIGAKITYAGGVGGDDIVLIVDSQFPGVAAANAAVFPANWKVCRSRTAYASRCARRTPRRHLCRCFLVLQNTSTARGIRRSALTDGPPARPHHHTITATDTQTFASNTTFTYFIDNVALMIALTRGQRQRERRQRYALTVGAITEPGADTRTGYSINWGDGITENFTGQSGRSSLSHTYADGAEQLHARRSARPTRTARSRWARRR